MTPDTRRPRGGRASLTPAATPAPALAGLALAALLAGAAPAATPEDHPVSFTADQADRGEETYGKHCQECHGEDLKGGMNGGAPLRGLSFVQKYEGGPASAMFAFMTNAMPPNSPGRFSDSTYADLMAYILKRNGFQPGAALPSDLDALDHVLIEK